MKSNGTLRNLVVLEVVGGKFFRLEIEHLFAEIWLEMLLRLCEGVKVTIDLSTYSLQCGKPLLLNLVEEVIF